MGFSSAFSSAFSVDSTDLFTVDPGVYYDQTKRPEHPPYSKLWGYYMYPQTPAGLLLWKSGQVKMVDSFYDNDYLTCDDAILGGTVWATTEDSWQAQVLVAAGYTLIPYYGSV